MRPPDNDPGSDELEDLRDDEDRGLLENPSVPDDVKSEVAERLERFRDEAIDEEIEDEPFPR
jgi:hypothetical protein